MRIAFFPPPCLSFKPQEARSRTPHPHPVPPGHARGGMSLVGPVGTFSTAALTHFCFDDPPSPLSLPPQERHGGVNGGLWTASVRLRRWSGDGAWGEAKALLQSEGQGTSPGGRSCCCS